MMFVHFEHSGWVKMDMWSDEGIARDNRGIIECTSDGTPLSELATPADGPLTLAEFDAFSARVRANLALLEKEGER